MNRETSTPSSSNAKPVRLRIPGILDIVLISDREQIQWLNQHADVTRPLDPTASFLHRLVSRRLTSDLGFHGGVLPVFQPRSDTARAERQRKLAQQLEDSRGSPGEERDHISAYVSGKKDLGDIDVTVQQWCGRLFLAHYRAAASTYEAGRLIAGWPSAPPWRTLLDRLTGRLDRAKDLALSAAEGDLHCVHATTIGMENVARSVRKLRAAAKDARKRAESPDDILRDCLVAPPAVLRGCAGEIDAPFVHGGPLTRRTILVFLVARAYANSGELDVAFLADQWSECPAHRVVPEMLRAVWYAAHQEASKEDGRRPVPAINTLSHLWHRAVS